MFCGMKTLVALVCFVFAVGVAHAQSSPAPETADPKAPVTKAAPAKKEVKKPEPLPKIPGIEIARPNGTFLGLEIVGTQFHLTFYTAKKKKMTIDVTRAAARWNNTRGAGDHRTILNGSGTTLVGSKPVRPPFAFNVYLTLLQGEGDDATAVETYVVPYRG